MFLCSEELIPFWTGQCVSIAAHFLLSLLLLHILWIKEDNGARTYVKKGGLGTKHERTPLRETGRLEINDPRGGHLGTLQELLINKKTLFYLVLSMLAEECCPEKVQRDLPELKGLALSTSARFLLFLFAGASWWFASRNLGNNIEVSTNMFLELPRQPHLCFLNRLCKPVGN